MDKITHQVRAEHWTKIMNECINSGMPKTAWCRANGVSEKQFFYWQRILRREAFENSQNASLPGIVGPDLALVPATQRTVSFTEIKLLRTQLRFSIRICNPKRRYHPGNIEFRFKRAPFTDWRHPGC